MWECILRIMKRITFFVNIDFWESGMEMKITLQNVFVLDVAVSLHYLSEVHRSSKTSMCGGWCMDFTHSHSLF